MRETGILSDIETAAGETTVQAIAQRLGLSEYGVRVLLEAGLGMGLVTVRDERYRITKTAHYLERPMTRAKWILRTTSTIASCSI